jgi:hypothetical protein
MTRRGQLRARPCQGATGRAGAERGQASVLIVGGLVAVVLGALVLGLVARGGGKEARAQRAADLGALAAARAMHDAYPRLFEPIFADRERPGAHHLGKADYLALGRAAGERVARANGAGGVRVAFPDSASFAPVRVRVTVHDTFSLGGHDTPIQADGEAELAPPGELATAGDGYAGPLASRQGQRMRPDVASAFDRMEHAAGKRAVSLIITSAYRSDAEQAILFARHPDPRWVAPPGRSLHRLGTELDLGPPAAYGWLARNARRFHFTQRYSWEPWHYGYTLNAHSAPAAQANAHADGKAGSALPSFVPPAFAPAIAHAAQRWNVSATLLAAQLYAESNFNPLATSGAGAQGIAQFMPGTAAAIGLDDPFDAQQSIDAQAHLMRDLLRQFPALPLALAAYNAGPTPVRACGCVPANDETPGYVARILGLMAGAGASGAGAPLEVRLVS